MNEFLQVIARVLSQGYVLSIQHGAVLIRKNETNLAVIREDLQAPGSYYFFIRKGGNYYGCFSVLNNSHDIFIVETTSMSDQILGIETCAEQFNPENKGA